MSLASDALRTAVLKTLADDVDDAVTGGKGNLAAIMKELGIKSLTAKLDDGTEVATLTLAGGASSPRVANPREFLAWVQETHPGETEVVVRDGYKKKLLDLAKKEGRAVDPVSGEVVPGIEFSPGSQYVSVSFAKGRIPGRDAIRDAWANGGIDLREMIALPAAPTGSEAAA
jgi:hypothetical protein